MHIQLFAKPCVGNNGSGGNAQRGEQGKLPRSPAVNEGDFRRADHVNDQRLRPQRFHKPACMENCQHGQEKQANCAGMSHGRCSPTGFFCSPNRRMAAKQLQTWYVPFFVNYRL